LSLEKFGEVGEVGEMGEKFILGTEGSGIFSDDHELALPLLRGENSVKVPLFKGDLGGSQPTSTKPIKFENIP